MKIHLGCGKRDFGSDWLHIDGGEFPHVKFNNITQLPFFNDAADIIYASHVIAYFDREEIIPVLQEWKRVLKPGGKLRLATPDIFVLSKLLANCDVNFEQIAGPVYGKMQMGDKIIYHKTGYTFGSLYNLLNKIGFKEYGIYDWRKTDHANIDDHSQAYIPHMDKENGTLISLNIEAIK